MTKRAWPLLLLAAAPAWSAFQTDLSSVRSSSLGGAFTATAQGAADLFGTPAALAGTTAPEASLMYTKPFAGLAEEEFGAGAMSFALPSRWGTWGAGIAAFRAQGALEETTFSLAYGVSFMDGRVRAGAALKRLDHKYLIADDPLAQNDPLFQNGAASSAWDADLALGMDVMGPIQAGITVRNVRRADVGLAGQDRLRREIQGGVAFNLPAWGVTALGDLFYRSAADGAGGDLSPAAGLEKAFHGPVPVFLRAGANKDRFSAGLGLVRGRLSLDYAFLMPRALMGADASTHQVQMTWRLRNAESR